MCMWRGSSCRVRDVVRSGVEMKSAGQTMSVVLEGLGGMGRT